MTSGRPGGAEGAKPGLGITCAELVEAITDYLEGALDEATNAEIEAHLALCPHCQVYVEQMRATIGLLGHVPVETLSSAARDDLLAVFRGYRGVGPAGNQPAR